MRAVAGQVAERRSLRTLVTALIATWDDQANRDTDIVSALEAPIDALRRLLASKAPRAAGVAAPRAPRAETKQATVIALLGRPEGATIAQIVAITGWAQHTVRGFLAGLKKKGHAVETLERVRQVGPNKQGAKGSFTIYHIPAPATAA